MAKILGTDTVKLPTSFGGVKNFGKSAVGVATTGLVIVAGLGILAMALPWARRIPVLGAVFGASRAGAAAVTDAFGTQGA